MADPKDPQKKTGSGASSARPRSPVIDLSATDVTKTSGASAAADKPAETTPKAAPVPDAAPKASPDAAPAATSDPRPAAAAAAVSGAPAGSTSASPSAGATPAGAPLAGAETGVGTAKPDAVRPQSGASAASAASIPAGGRTYVAGAPAGAAPLGARPASVQPAAAPPSSSSAPPPAASAVGVGFVGVALATLLGAALAVFVVVLFGRELLGVRPPDTSRVAAAESKLDAVGRDIAALRERAGQPAPAIDTSAIDTRVAELAAALEAASARSQTLETELRALAAKPAAVTIDTTATDALAKRLDAAEAQAKQAPTADAVTALGARIDGIGPRIDDLQPRIDAVGARIDGVGATVAQAVAPLAERIGGLDTGLASLDAALKARPIGDPAARLVVALGALDQALAAGRPFPAELAAAKGAGADVAPFAALAETGAPTRPALAAELAGVMAGLPPLRAAQSGSVFDRFVANAGSIVTVTGADAPAGAAPADIRARVSSRAAAGDVAGALADRPGLDDAAKAATEGWAARASARIAAETALAGARTAALARLGSN